MRKFLKVLQSVILTISIIIPVILFLWGLIELFIIASHAYKTTFVVLLIVEVVLVTLGVLIEEV